MVDYGKKLAPSPMTKDVTITNIVDEHLLAYNAARLREACQLLAREILQPNTLVGLTLSGALTPAGLGVSCIVPLIEAGWIDWIVSTGANLYHDMHRSLGCDLHGIVPYWDDLKLREEKLIRIYDILFDQEVLFKTDAFVAQVVSAPEFQKRMGTAELHYKLGRYVCERERILGISSKSVLSAAFEAGVPVYTSSPGDSTIGMIVAARRLAGNGLSMDPEQDVNETTAIVYHAKKTVGKSAIVILGGGSPKNFALQTEPQLQEIMRIPEAGHDYFIQVTDARPDTGGLSGATPSEAVTWGKIDPNQLPDTVVCYCESTIALPIMTAYLLANATPRPLRRLYDRRDEMLNRLLEAFVKNAETSAT
ncbi:MAG: deoxyhypusine synthase [Chloroflexi bacterium]|nr:deoxyhypusine synthase [Chloroflexota bacterium]